MRWLTTATSCVMLVMGDIDINHRPSALELARGLDVPQSTSTSGGEHEAHEFWEENADLLAAAWHEWESTGKSSTRNNSNFSSFPDLTLSTLLDSNLLNLVTAAWQNVNDETENAIKQLFTKVAPGVYQFRLLGTGGVQRIRQALDMMASSGIPTRRPNGMNRYGIIVSPDADGAVQVDFLNACYQDLINVYVRPLGRLLFPDYFGAVVVVKDGDDSTAVPPRLFSDDDTENYAFTVRYHADEDVSLKEHADASLITLNVNLNLPHEEYKGSSLYFVENTIDGVVRHNVTFAPGMALLHLGQTRHAALPINSGNRTNLIAWLFGEDGHVRVTPYKTYQRLTPQQRWSSWSPITWNPQNNDEL